MASKPEEILETARWLLSDGNQSEAMARVIINRSYYSMYHKVLSSLDNEPVVYGDTGVHGRLIDYLTSSDAKKNESISDKGRKQLAYALKQEKSKRAKADYDMDEDLDFSQAEQTFSAAQRCFTRCDDMLRDLKAS
jgi:hypothetical protein